MAQKSLSVLNKVGDSMIWYTTFFYKNYMWLSAQNLYLLYFFNKLFSYMDYFLPHFFWYSTPRKTLYYTKVNKKIIRKSKSIRYFKPITSYLINTNEKFLIINVYYKSDFNRNNVKVSNLIDNSFLKKKQKRWHISKHTIAKYLSAKKKKLHTKSTHCLNSIFYFL